MPERGTFRNRGIGDRSLIGKGSKVFIEGFCYSAWCGVRLTEHSPKTKHDVADFVRTSEAEGFSFGGKIFLEDT